jgi:secreted Zn-dependent insulinase-like peptidase
VLRVAQRAQDFLASRIEAFLSEFSDHLNTLESDVFQSHVASLVARYRESDKNIGALHDTSGTSETI